MIRVYRALAVAAVFGPLSALAQTTTPGGTLGPPPGGTIGEEEPKKEGVAEEAPKEPTPLPTLPPLPPYPGQEHKKFELLELDGYMRFRADWLNDLNLGFRDVGAGAPFHDPIACRDASPEAGQQPANADACGGSIGSSNMRVRLEPTINLSETVHLHLQVDVLDNVVLGSTASGVFPDADPNMPAGSLSGGQTSPESGRNSPWTSIRAKRAWAEVKTPLGSLQFGRMPSHWGLGIASNSGGYDWIHDTVCVDCDYGDSVDRFMFGTTIPGTSLQAAVGLDWNASGPGTGQLAEYRFRNDGQPMDLDDKDDVTQYVVILSHMSEPEEWRRVVREGKTAFDYGLQFFYRTQDFETLVPFGSDNPQGSYRARHASLYLPDLWARFTTANLVVEAEVAGVFGTVDNFVDATKEDMSLAQIGAVARLQYLALDGDLELGGEVGYASGDQWDDPRPGDIHIDDANYLPRGDDNNDFDLTRFQFNRDYHVDLILWRELYGAVTNAVYGKPWVRYNISDRFHFRAQAVMSFAPKPIATPGNASLYGIELDGEVGYSNEDEGFFAGLAYGVLFPMAAMDHPIDLPEFANEPDSNAGTAQTFQARAVLKF
jgi:uncharacterized protein (TIGR04551 family)